jgi:ATP-dependent helicase/nuclease subunit A
VSADQLSLDLPDDQLAADETPQQTLRADVVEVEYASDHELREEQRTVVELAADYVVTAGAGSGKTRTLVALYSALLEVPALTHSSEPIGPHRILCLTFTERAARELLRKVRERTSDPRWRRELESAPISTFHGWCSELLRRYPLEAGIDPRFSILPEESAEELIRTAALDSLRVGLERGDAAARQAVEILGLGAAAETLADLVTRIRTAGWPPRRVIERFEERLAEADRRLGPLVDEIDEAAGRAVAAAAAAAMRTDKQLAAIDRMSAAHRAWRAARSIAAAEELDAAARGASNWRFDDATPLRKTVTERTAAWLALSREIEHRFQLGIWPALSVTVREAYRATRAARGALDYDDLLLRTRDLLRSHAEVLKEVRGRYRAVLIDEHQDTDPVQDEILRILVGEDAIQGRPGDCDPRWCVVGDAKQSIYGFRGATVEAFELLARQAARRGARQDLATNYRSRAELVDFHNAFFPSVLVEGPAANRPGYVEQVAFRTPGGGPGVELLDPGTDRREVEEARESEARALAARLAAACGGEPGGVLVWDTELGVERPARPGDIVILIRRLTQVEPYRRALDLVGLESVVVGSGSFWVRQETFDILNAFESVLRPQDPVPLVGFLRSPMAGLADDSIWRLVRGWGFDRPLGAHLAASADAAELEPDQAAALRDALDVLAGIAARADVLPPGDVVAWLVDRTGYASVLDALPDRAQRRANVERLIALADRAPGQGHVLLSEWAGAVRRRAERPPRDRDASLPEVGDRIRILTIHQAKGLEFPVVALADIGGRGGRGPRGVRFDPRLGVVAKVWTDPADKPLDTRAYALARDAARENEEAEEARLLYVAATRARDRLILTAGATGAPWLKLVRAFLDDPRSSGLIAAVPLARWEARFEESLGEAAALADSGIPVLSPVDAALGEAAARELAEALVGEGPLPAPVSTAREAAAEALARGVRGHAALERLPLDPPPPDLAAWLAGPGALAPAEARALAAYAGREIVPALGAAEELARERPFRLSLPGGGVVVGAIDALWRDREGSWWVGDYKFAGEDPETGARHDAQLSIYALAASAAIGIEEVRGRLWYVDAGVVRDLRWQVADLRSLESALDAAFGRIGPARPTAWSNVPPSS